MYTYIWDEHLECYLLHSTDDLVCILLMLLKVVVAADAVDDHLIKVNLILWHNVI